MHGLKLKDTHVKKIHKMFTCPRRESVSHFYAITSKPVNLYGDSLPPSGVLRRMFHLFRLSVIILQLLPTRNDLHYQDTTIRLLIMGPTPPQKRVA